MFPIINSGIQFFTKIRMASSCFRSAILLEDSSSISYDSACRIAFIVFDINILYFLSQFRHSISHRLLLFATSASGLPDLAHRFRNTG